MKTDTTLIGGELADVGQRAAELEALGYDGAYTFEGPNDPFFPPRDGGSRDRARRALHRGCDRVCAQSDVAREYRLRPAEALEGSLHPGARLADPPAHHAPLRYAVVEARATYEGDGPGHQGDLALLERGWAARLPRRAVSAHADDAHVQSRPEPRTETPRSTSPALAPE